MKEFRNFAAIAIIAAALSIGLPPVNFMGMVLIFLLTVFMALLCPIIANNTDVTGRNFGVAILSAIFGMCILGGIVNSTDIPLWLIITILTVILWIKLDKCMLYFAAWLTGSATAFFIQHGLGDEFFWDVCVVMLCVLAYDAVTILPFFTAKDDESKKD